MQLVSSKLPSDSSIRIGYEYVEGYDSSTLYDTIQQSCGCFVGFFKAWLPCIGCFCFCYQNPYTNIQQGTKGILLRYGRYMKTLQPGLIYINPATESVIRIDCRIQVLNFPSQRLMTKDYITILIDSCSYYHIENPHLAYFRMQNMNECVAKVSGGIIKNTVSKFTFQELLEKRQEISNDIKQQIQPITQHWGINIDQIFLKDFGISKDLEFELVSAPVARRQAQSSIINAQGDVVVAERLNSRSKILDSKTAMQVRYLDTVKSLAINPKSRIIYSSY